MKYFKKSLLFFLVIFIAIVGFNYNSGTPVDELIENYTYPESGFMQYDDMKVHYRKTGTGPVLVLLHGVASSLHTWEGWHRELSNDFTVISLDVPGFGLTGPNPNDDYSVKMYMSMLDKLLEELHIDSCFIAGNSFGGYLTWNYALHNVSRVKKIALINASGFNANRKIENPGFKLAMNPLTKGISHRITPYFLVKKSVEDVYGDKSKVTKQTVQRYYDLLLRRGNREAFSEILNQLHNGNIKTGLIKNVTQPTLIMWGSHDRIIDPEDASRFQEAIKDSKMVMYPDVGHIPMEEIPIRTASDIKNFLINN